MQSLNRLMELAMLKEKDRGGSKELHSPITHTQDRSMTEFKILPVNLYTQYKKKGQETSVVSEARSKGTSDTVNILQ